MLQRIEVNVLTGDRLRFEQKAYRNDQGDVIIQDATDEAPEGYDEFDPEVETKEKSEQDQ